MRKRTADARDHKFRIKLHAKNRAKKRTGKTVEDFMMMKRHGKFCTVYKPSNSRSWLRFKFDDIADYFYGLYDKRLKMFITFMDHKMFKNKMSRYQEETEFQQ